MGTPSDWTTQQRYLTGRAVLAAESPAEAVLIVRQLAARDGARRLVVDLGRPRKRGLVDPFEVG